MIVFRAQGVTRFTYNIEEYGGPLTTLNVHLATGEHHQSLRVVLRDDLYTFSEVGRAGDEVQIVDVSEQAPETLKFGSQYRFEWWSRGKLSISFKVEQWALTKSLPA